MLNTYLTFDLQLLNVKKIVQQIISNSFQYLFLHLILFYFLWTHLWRWIKQLRVILATQTFCSALTVSFIYLSDLRAFEKRLTEVVNYLQPSMWRYRSKKDIIFPIFQLFYLFIFYFNFWSYTYNCYYIQGVWCMELAIGSTDRKGIILHIINYTLLAKKILIIIINFTNFSCHFMNRFGSI